MVYIITGIMKQYGLFKVGPLLHTDR